MESLYEWIRNITYYLIFMTVAANLLPNKKYEKYFHLFAGMVLVLLVLRPFTGGFRLDDKIAYYFEAIRFQKEATELKSQLSAMEETRLASMISQYEEAVDGDLKTMAEASGFICKNAKAGIDGDEKNKSFGHVVSVSLTIAPDHSENKEESGESGESREGGESGEEASLQLVKPIEPIRVKAGGGNMEAAETVSEAADERGRDQHLEENSALTGLRRRISEYYNLEEQDIEIQMENE